MRQRAIRSAAVAVVAVLGLAYGAPAMAHSGRGHAYGRASQAKGSRHSDSGTRYTEDNDTNDGGTPNNQPDSGDNLHPSGKDRSVENGNSGNQGNAASDPDDDGHGPDRSNGGPDKPNGSGGVDKADQDGNNGCGNDDDFEDDNEGWCGHHPKPDHSCSVSSTETLPPGQAKKCDESVEATDTDQCTEFSMSGTDESGTDECGTETEASARARNQAGRLASRLTAKPDVLGLRIVKGTTPAAVVAAASGGRMVAGAPLAFTGGNLLPFVIAAIALILVGVVLLRRRKLT